MSIRNRIADQNFRLTKACPAQNSNTDSDELDLQSVELGPVGAGLEMVLTIPATDTLAEGQTIIVDIEHSATSGSGFADVPGCVGFTATGAAGDVSTEQVFRFYLPPETKRYLRFEITTSATSGDVTDTTVSLEGRV